MALEKVYTAKANVIVDTGGAEKLKSLQDSLTAINNLISDNGNITRYWKSQEQLISAAKSALDRYRASQDQASGKELVNSINAIKGAINGFDISSIASGIEGAYESARKLTSGMDGIYDVSKFSQLFSAIGTLKDNIAGADDLLEKIFAGADASKAVQQIQYYKQALVDAQVEISNLREKLDFFDQTDIGSALAQLEEYKNQITQLENKLEELRLQFTQSGVDKFSSFLRSQNIISSEDMESLQGGFNISSVFDDSDVRRFIDNLIEEIRQGTKDADTAIAQFKQTFHNLIEDSGGMNPADLQQITSAIEGMASSARSVGDASSGINVGNLDEFISLLRETSGGINLPDFSSFIESLEQMSKLNVDGGVDSVRRLINAFQGDLSVSGSSLSKLGDGLSALTRDFDPGKLAALSSLKFDNLNSLKVSKASLNNLATYLPQIASANVENLKRLSELNFSNLTKEGGLNISKSAMEGLATLANQTDLTSITGALEQLATKMDSLFDRMSSSSKTTSDKLVGENAKVAMSLAEASDRVDQLKETYAQLGDSSMNSKLEETATDIAELNFEYEQGILTNNNYKNSMAIVEKNLKNLETTAKQTAKAQKEAAKEAEEAARKAEKEAEKESTLEEDPAKLEQYITKFTSLEASIRQNLANWSKAQNGRSAESYKNLKDVADATHEASQALDGLTATEADDKLKELSTNAKQYSNEIKISGDNTKTFGDKLAIAIKKYATFFTGMHAFMKIVQYSKQAVNAITEIDYAMNQLKIVSRETDTALAGYADSITKIADATAGSVTDLIDATTTYSRLGYSLEDSTVLAKLTQMLQNVGDIEASDAQNAITAVIKAFDLQIGDMELVLDRMVNVGRKMLPSGAVMCRVTRSYIGQSRLGGMCA